MTDFIRQTTTRDRLAQLCGDTWTVIATQPRVGDAGTLLRWTYNDPLLDHHETQWLQNRGLIVLASRHAPDVVELLAKRAS